MLAINCMELLQEKMNYHDNLDKRYVNEKIIYAKLRTCNKLTVKLFSSDKWSYLAYLIENFKNIKNLYIHSNQKFT